MQPQGHSQMMIRIFDYAQNPQTASDAPRWRVLGNLRVALEKGFVSGVVEELKILYNITGRFLVEIQPALVPALAVVVVPATSIPHPSTSQNFTT